MTDMEELKERLRIKIKILNTKMADQAKYRAYTEAARLQAEINSLEDVQLMIKQIEDGK